jgi:hypothetical protein
MDMSVVEHTISAVIGAITGAISSLVAPWANWGVEKRRLRQSRRAELVTQWRSILGRPDFNRREFLQNPAYGPLQHLLQEKVREEIERPANHITIIRSSPVQDHDKSLLLKEVARIEKKWGLI